MATNSDKPGLIFSRIPKIIADLSAVKKGRTSEQGYKFRGIDDVLLALKPAFVEHKVFVLTEVLSQIREPRTTKSGAQQTFSIMTVKFTLCAEDGSSVTVITVGEAQDTGDKSSSKSMSVAFKYMAVQIFCIPTDEPADDPEHGRQEEVGRPAGKPVAKSGTKPSQTVGAKTVAAARGALFDRLGKAFKSFEKACPQNAKFMTGITLQRYGKNTSKELSDTELLDFCEYLEKAAAQGFNDAPGIRPSTEASKSEPPQTREDAPGSTPPPVAPEPRPTPPAPKGKAAGGGGKKSTQDLIKALTVAGWTIAQGNAYAKLAWKVETITELNADQAKVLMGFLRHNPDFEASCKEFG